MFSQIDSEHLAVVSMVVEGVCAERGLEILPLES